MRSIVLRNASALLRALAKPGLAIVLRNASALLRALAKPGLAIVLLVLLVAPSLAIAKPSVAVAPLDGDDSGKVGEEVADAAGRHANVTPSSRTQKAADSLGLTDYDSPKSAKKLRNRLKVDAVIHGHVEKDGKKHVLSLAIYGRGKKERKLEIHYKTTKELHKALRERLAEKLDVEGDEHEESEEEEAAREKAEREKAAREDLERKQKAEREELEKKQKTEREEQERQKKEREAKRDKHKKRDDDEGDDSDKRKKHHDDSADSDDDKHKRGKRTATSDDDDQSVSDSDEDHPRRHKHHHEQRNPVTQAALWLDAGAAGLHRTLDYTTSQAGMPPPPVGTASFSPELEGEVYPGSFDTLDSGTAAIGIAASFGKTFGLSIHVPGTNLTAPINEGHESIGARYRFTFGQSSVAVGADLWRMHYIADRGSLGTAMLDMPDVDYTGVAPVATARLGASPTIGILLSAEVPLVLAAGQITSAQGYGQASILAFAVQGGVDIELAPHYGLRLALVYDQVGLSFSKAPRGVSDATDRTIGVVGSFAILY